MKQAERDSTVQVAALRAEAISGENQAETQGVIFNCKLFNYPLLCIVAESNSMLQIKRAEFYQAAETRERQAKAAVQEAENLAQAKAALALAEKVQYNFVYHKNSLEFQLVFNANALRCKSSPQCVC